MDSTRERATGMFTAVMSRFMSNDAQIATFVRLTKDGLNSITPSLARSNLLYVQATFPEFFRKNILLNEDFAHDEEVHKKAAGDMTAHMIRGTITTIEAAALAFAHSMSEAALDDLLEITILVEPAAWSQYVARRKVSLSDVAGKSKEELESEAIRDYFLQLKKESILKKADHLHAICKPPPGFMGVTAYTYSRDRLAQVDRLRQDILHRQIPDTPIADLDGLLEFNRKTTMHFISLVNNRYDMRIDPNKWFQQQGKKP